MEVVLDESPNIVDKSIVVAGVLDYGLEQVDGIKPIDKALYLKDSDTIVGGATMREHFDSLFLDYLWVSEKYRGRGHGSLLLSIVVEYAKSRKCKSIQLQTLNEKVVPLYIRAGFKLEAKIDHYVKDFDLYYLAIRF